MLAPIAPPPGPTSRTRPSVAPGPKRLPTQLSSPPGAFVVRCETPWGSYTCRGEQTATESARELLDRVHDRLALELERVVEGSNGDAPCASRSFAELMLAPELYTRRPQHAWSRFQGQQCPARAASEERVTVHIEARTLLSAELSFDSYFAAPLCAALLGNGSRWTTEECIARVVMAVVHEELAREAPLPRAAAR